jgi:glycosyltransferase involved in cell wall biosynthesis
MIVVHLTSSPFFGGPEQQMLGLARSLPASYRSVFLAFAEGGRCRGLLDEVQRHGFEGIALRENVPHYRAVLGELTGLLRRWSADVLCCHGYKADLLGWCAARRAGIPVVAVSHGWTAATLKVRLNELLDRWVLRWMDGTVCVSEAQALKVRRAGVPPDRTVVIRNAIQSAATTVSDTGAQRLADLFAVAPRRFVLAAGRLSPEKGFDQLIEAASIVVAAEPAVGFVLFGDGPECEPLSRQIFERRLQRHVVLAGFRRDWQRFLPQADLFALASHTEGLPVVVLEALAAGAPVVATAVGGTPEVVTDGATGYLVPAREPAALAGRILDLLRDDARRREMGNAGRQRVREDFTFASQSVQYQRLFERLCTRTGARATAERPLPALISRG